MMHVTLESIQAARGRIRGAITHTPCPYSPGLSRLYGCEIYCKFDHLQRTGSFKERGARNKLLTLSEEQKRAGVVAVSAGNHALGLACHGEQLGIPVTVVMPRWAPLIKVSNCRLFGANIIQHGESYAEAKLLAEKLGRERKLTFISGFDDAEIIAGQGTMGLEILEDVPDVDAIVVGVGGGGLIAGVAVAVKGLKPDVRIIGAESDRARTMYASLHHGCVVPCPTQPTLADGLAVAEAGGLCFDIVRELVEQIVLVDELQIATAILRLLEMEKTLVEGAAAVPLAVVSTQKLGLEGKKVVLCLGGGNIDMTLLGHIIERGLAADGRLCRIYAYISDRPGSLAQLLAVIAETAASVKEVSHDRSFGPADVGRVGVVCVMETRDFAHIGQITEALTRAGIELRG